MRTDDHVGPCVTQNESLGPRQRIHSKHRYLANEFHSVALLDKKD
jgi:hypothetical protein